MFLAAILLAQLMDARAFAERATNRELPSSERDTAFTVVEQFDFERAVEIAPSFLAEEDQILRARAAWVLAQAGKETGFAVLRAMAGERTEASTLAMQALGRIRDPSSHGLLRQLLEQELSREDPDRGRVSGLVHALSDYEDAGDASLLARAVTTRGGGWVQVEALGRTGGTDAIPALEVYFRRGQGHEAMSAGLALARCGAPAGRKYVAERLRDTSGANEDPIRTAATDAYKDDPNGPKARDFILGRLGASVDQFLVPEMLRIIQAPGYSGRAKARAWVALLRINPERERREILALAWKDPESDTKARFIVLNDEAAARKALEPGNSSLNERERFALKEALRADPRQRRRWRELHGYPL
jgi:HEAT repeat protein